MAEIKSTLEMVLERAARMEKEAVTAPAAEEKMREGMRLAAGYLRGEKIDLAAACSRSGSAPDTAELQRGVVNTLLRNITLPRHDEQQDTTEKAIQGLLAAGPGLKDLQQIFAEMKSILSRYPEHKKQLRQQLEAAFSQQMEQLEQSMAKKTGIAVKMEPSKHPKFQEEWLRLCGELDEQYGRAIAQHKALIEQRLSA